MSQARRSAQSNSYSYSQAEQRRMWPFWPQPFGTGRFWAMALSLAVVAVAGVFLAVRSNFDPSMGPARLIFGFEAVIIGGLGNLWGTLAGGVVLGVAQAIGAKIDPGWQLLAGHLAFLIVLAIKPEGFFPRVQH